MITAPASFWSQRGGAGPNTFSLALAAASSQYAIYPGAPADFNIGADKLTMLQWVWHTALGGTQVYQGQFDFSTGQEAYAGYYISSGGDKLRFRLEDPGGSQDYVQWSETPPVGAWINYGFVWDGALTVATGSMKLFVNAVDAGAPAPLTTNNITALKASTAAYKVGAWNSTPTGFMNGKLDEVRVYQAALTGPQIAAIMASQAEGLPAPYHHYPFNGDYVDAAAGANLAGVNAPTFSPIVPFP